MVSFEDFALGDGSPIYMQIVRHIKQSIVAGKIQNGQELPSRRMLSALLGVNPNTVQKAYRLLEDEAIIESRPGAASYATLGEDRVKLIRQELIDDQVRAAVKTMQRMGISKKEALALLERLWD